MRAPDGLRICINHKKVKARFARSTSRFKRLGLGITTFDAANGNGEYIGELVDEANVLLHMRLASDAVTQRIIGITSKPLILDAAVFIV